MQSEVDGLHPVLVHSHPKVEGVSRSSPPSTADLRVGMVEGILKQRIAAHDGYYEFEFAHPLDKAERANWNMVAVMWAKSHPESEALRSYRENSLGRVGRGETPPAVGEEVYRRQHEALVYHAEQMPDVFSYRFVPWE